MKVKSESEVIATTVMEMSSFRLLDRSNFSTSKPLSHRTENSISRGLKVGKSDLSNKRKEDISITVVAMRLKRYTWARP